MQARGHAWPTQGTNAEKLEALRKRVDSLGSRLEEVARTVSTERQEREGAIRELRAELAERVDRLERDVTMQRELSTELDARGVLVTTLAIIVLADLSWIESRTGYLGLTIVVLASLASVVAAAVVLRQHTRHGHPAG